MPRRKASRNTLTVAKVALALRKRDGVYAQVALALKVTRQAVQQFVETHPELLEVRKESKESVVDVGETELMKLVKAGEFQAIKYLLNCQGKARGWVERHELRTITDAEADGLVEEALRAVAGLRPDGGVQAPPGEGRARGDAGPPGGDAAEGGGAGAVG